MTMESKAECPRCHSPLQKVAEDSHVCPQCELAGALGNPQPPIESSVETLGDYVIESLIAHGGMGAVYRAYHRGNGKSVAIKTLLAGRLAGAESRKRFFREARLASQLQHRHIVPTLDVGESEGVPYLVMEEMAGKSLAELVRDGPLAPEAAAEIIAKVAGALAHAHDQGVLHRDLKPANILLDADGEPRVSDFGLARLMEGHSTELTMSGQMLGSPGYLPPERIPRTDDSRSKNVEGIGVASDVYSLGATLYHLMTGRPPFQAATLEDVLIQVSQSEPISLRKLNPSVPVAMEAVCLKCLEKEPCRRYADMREFGEDLGRFLAGETVRARLPGILARSWKWCCRRRALAATGATVLVLLLTVSIGSPIAAFRINREKLRTQLAEREGRLRLHESYTAQAHATIQSSEAGRRGRALEAIRQAALIRVTPELRREAFAALAAPDLQPEFQIALGQDFQGVSLDREFNRFAQGRANSTVEIRSLPQGEMLFSFAYGSNQSMRLPSFSADGRYLAFKRDIGAGELADLDVWDLRTTQRVFAVREAVSKAALKFHPRLPRLLVGRPEAWLTEWNVDENRIRAEWPLASRPWVLSYSPEGDRAAVYCRADGRHRIEIRDLANGALLIEVILRSLARQVLWHPDGGSVAVTSDDGSIHLINTRDGSAKIIGSHNAQATHSSFALGGEFLITSGWDSELNIWNLRLGGREMMQSQSVSAMQIGPDQRRLAILGKSDLSLFQFRRSPECRELESSLVIRARTCRFSPDSRWLVVEGGEGFAVWDLANPGPAAVEAETQAQVLEFSPDSKQFLSWQRDQCVRWKVQEAAPGQPPALTKEFVGTPTNATPVWRLAPDGALDIEWKIAPPATHYGLGRFEERAAMTSDDAWQVRRFPESRVLSFVGLPLGADRQLITNRTDVQFHAFHPSNHELLVLTEDELKWLRPPDWQPGISRPANGKVLRHLAFSSDGRLLLCVENSQTASICDANTLEPLLPMPVWSHPMGMSPDSRWLVVRVAGRRDQLWDFKLLRTRLRELGLDWADANQL